MAMAAKPSELAEIWASSLAALHADHRNLPGTSDTILSISRAKILLQRYFQTSAEGASPGPGPSKSFSKSEAQHALSTLRSSSLENEAYDALHQAARERLQREFGHALAQLEVAGISGVPDCLDVMAAQVVDLNHLALDVGLVTLSVGQISKDILLTELRHRPKVLQFIRDWIDAIFSAETARPRLNNLLSLRARRQFAVLEMGDIVRLSVQHAARKMLHLQVHWELGDSEEGKGSPASATVVDDFIAWQAKRARELPHQYDDGADSILQDQGDEPGEPTLDPEKAARPLLIDFILTKLTQSKVKWCGEVSPDENAGQGQAAWQEGFIYYMDTLITKIRSSQLFDLTMDWPTSIPALSDLKTSLEETRMKVFVSSQLQASLEKRLLHPGARTRDILEVYVSLVYAVRFIDPSGVILSRIAGPIRRYLRSRSDTVPVIVASLLGDDEAFIHLRGELDAAGKIEAAGGVTQADTSLGGGDRDEEEEEDQRLVPDGPISLTAPPPPKVVDYQDPNYEPQPIDAGPSYKQTRSADVIAMLVSIFDDKASFVKALEISTARALLKSEDYEVTREYRNNEVLKRRFGDTSLARCDVMLQDIIDSRRVDTSVRQLLSTPLHHLTSPTKKKLPADPASSGLTEEFRALKPLITSRHFWPDLEGSEVPPTAPTDSSKPVSLASIGPPPGGLDLRLPSKMGRAMDDYNRTFTALRDSRRLRWLAGYGRVKVSVEMKDGRRWEEVVDPIRAGVLYMAGEKFEASEPLIVEDIEAEMNLQSGGRELEAALGYWCTRNVLAPVEARKGWYVECQMPSPHKSV